MGQMRKGGERGEQPAQFSCLEEERRRPTTTYHLLEECLRKEEEATSDYLLTACLIRLPTEPRYNLTAYYRLGGRTVSLPAGELPACHLPATYLPARRPAGKEAEALEGRNCLLMRIR